MATRSQPDTNERLSSPERVILPSAWLLGIGSLAGVVASWWALAGTTPAFVFARFESLRAWRSGEMYFGLPFEFWILVWSVGIGGVAFPLRTRMPHAWRVVLLLSAICLTASVGARAWDARLMHWPLNVMTIAAIGLLAGASMTFEASAVRSHRGPSWMARTLPLAWLLVLSAGGYAMRLHLQKTPPPVAAELNFLRWFEDVRRHSRPLDSTITIEVFNDYQCPFSALAVPRIGAVVEQYRPKTAERLHLSFRDFPLDSACNPGLAFGPHPAACEAAALVRFSQQSMSQEGRTELTDWVYAQGRGLTVASIRRYLDERNLSRQFDEVRDKLLGHVEADIISGLQRGVRATPTVFVNGIRLPNYVYLESALRAILAAEGT